MATNKGPSAPTVPRVPGNGDGASGTIGGPSAGPFKPGGGSGGPAIYKSRHDQHVDHVSHENHLAQQKRNGAKVRKQEQLVNKYNSIKKPTPADMAKIKAGAKLRQGPGSPVGRNGSGGSILPTRKSPTLNTRI